MVRNLASWLVVLGPLTGIGACGNPSAADNPVAARIYLSIFQSGQVVAADAATGKSLRRIPVQDGFGIAAIAVNPRGGNIFVVDGGNQLSRLRSFDPTTFALVKEEHFDHRVLNYSNYRLLQLSADGNWLFVYTADLPKFESIVRVYDIRRQMFEPGGIRDVACGAPVLASAVGGGVFALCPGKVQDISAPSAESGDFVAQAGAADHINEVIAAAATPDGRHVYAVGPSDADSAWQLVHWDRSSSGELTQRDLAAVLKVPAHSVGKYRWAWLGISDDGRSLALVHDVDAWLIDRETLMLSAHYQLPSAALGADFAPGGGYLLTLHRGNHDHEFSLVTTALSGGAAHAATVDSGVNNKAPVSFAVGAAH